MGEHDEDKTIQYSQWITTDRSTMVQQQEKISDYIYLIISQLRRLTSHSYIPKYQTKHLQKRKEQMDSSIALILGDF